MGTVTLLVQAGLVFIHPYTGEKFQVKPTGKPQQAPHWVTSSETYKAAHKQGLVLQINYVVQPPVKEEVALPSNVSGQYKVGFEPQQAISMESLMASGMTIEAAQEALSTMYNHKTNAATAVPAPVDYPANTAPTSTFTPDNVVPPPAIVHKAKTAPKNLSINANVPA